MEQTSPQKAGNLDLFASQMDNDEEKDQVLYYTFNQDSSCLAIGTMRGFRIYQCKPFCLANFADIGPISIIEMQFTSNILALVGLGDNPYYSQKKLTMWDTKIASATVEIQFQQKIYGVRMNSQTIYAATKDKIFIHSLQGMKLIQKIEIDSNNGSHLGRIALSPSITNPYLLYSTSLKDGDLVVFDTHTREKVNVVQCHRTPILKIAINFLGNMVATCSTQGSMIRIFSLPKGEKLYSFTRGIKNTTQYFLNFSRDSQFLVSTSDSGTIHVFQLDDNLPTRVSKNSIIDEMRMTQRPKQTSWLDYFLPKMCDDYMHAEKSLMSINFPALVQRDNILCLDFANTQIYSFSKEGEFFVFSMDIQKKAIKFILKKHMDDRSEDEL